MRGSLRYTLGPDGNWWLYACDNWLGYYPTPNSTTVVASKRINYGLMSTRGCRYQWFGETASRYFDDNGFWGAVDMGSGRYPAEGIGKAAYIRQPQHYWSGSWTAMTNAPMITGAGYDPNCYRIGNMVNSVGISGTKGFFLGGGGSNNLQFYPCQ